MWIRSGRRTLTALLSIFATFRVTSSGPVGTEAALASGPMLLAAVLCLGAGMMWWVGQSIEVQGSDRSASYIPSYSLEVHSADPKSNRDVTTVVMHTDRSAPIVDLSLDSSVSIVLRAEQRVTGPVALRSFLLRNGTLRPWATSPAVSLAGTFSLRAPVMELPDLLPGQSELVFVLGRPQLLLHTSLEDVVRGQHPLPAGLQILRATLCIHAGSDSPADSGPSATD